MKDRSEFLNFIANGIFNEFTISGIKEDLSLNDSQLIRDAFNFLNSEIGIIQNNTYFNMLIKNSVDLITILCDEAMFDTEEINVNRKRIKKARESLLAYANKFNNNVLLEAANKLDEIILDKSISEEDLIKLIKKLVDRKEDVDIIKKLLNTNKGVIQTDNNALFDHTFTLALNSLVDNNRDIFYYITLLKIFYNSNIPRKEYISRLNLVSDDKNPLANEIYNIIHGHKRSLKPEEVLKKYGFESNLSSIYIPSPSKITVPDLTLTIDGTNTTVRDDALSIRKDGNKYIVGIHISDPTVFIAPGSNIDIQTRTNYKSIYLPEDVIELLPDNMNSSLSLDKGKHRNVLSMYVVFSESGEIEDYIIKKDVIKVNENLSYESSDTLLNEYKNELSNKLSQLFTVACVLEQRYPKKKEYWDKKDASSLDKEVIPHRSDKIVNELMVLYNHLMARFMCEHNYPYIYRVQSNSYLEDMIKKMDIKLDENSERIVKSIYLKSYYSTYPMYHDGLKLDMYSQSSSPLRRYPDMYNQFLVHYFHFNDNQMIFDYDEYQNLVKYFNQRNVEVGLMRSEYSRAKKLVKS